MKSTLEAAAMQQLLQQHDSAAALETAWQFSGFGNSIVVALATAWRWLWQQHHGDGNHVLGSGGISSCCHIASGNSDLEQTGDRGRKRQQSTGSNIVEVAQQHKQAMKKQWQQCCGEVVVALATHSWQEKILGSYNQSSNQPVIRGSPLSQYNTICWKHYGLAYDAPTCGASCICSGCNITLQPIWPMNMGSIPCIWPGHVAKLSIDSNQCHSHVGTRCWWSIAVIIFSFLRFVTGLIIIKTISMSSSSVSLPQHQVKRNYWLGYCWMTAMNQWDEDDSKWQ